MLGKTHFLAGLFLACTFLSLHPKQPVLGFFVVIFFSLLPDIDEEHSYIGRKVKAIGFFFKHRGFFHSLFFYGLIVFFFLLLQNTELLLAASLGFFSHLLLDMFTKQGIQFFPFGKIRGPFRSGSLVEYLFRVLFILGSILVLFTLLM